MTTVEKIKNCRTVQDALIVLADEIDMLRQAEPADPFAQTLQWEAGVADRVERLEIDPAYTPEQANADAIRQARVIAVQEALSKTSDFEERRALEAELRLLTDSGGVIEPVRADGQRPVVNGNGEATIVDIPPASAQRQAERFAWAMNHKLHEFLNGFTAEQAAEEFSKGGAWWLYLSNRDAVMAMPDRWRVELVDDIAIDSPAAAHETARDVLKDTEQMDEGVARSRDRGTGAF